MIILPLRPYRKGRVWLNELPDLYYDIRRVVERVVPAEPSQIHDNRQAAIELFLPKGGRALYGALGAVFTPSSANLLVVQVGVSIDSEHSFQNSLAAYIDEVHIGL